MTSILLFAPDILCGSIIIAAGILAAILVLAAVIVGGRETPDA